MLKGFLVLAAATTFLPEGQTEGSGNDLRAFLTSHRCEVVDRLRRVHDFGNPADDTNRYLVISLPQPSWAYVQCYYSNRNRGLYCEAASGFYVDLPEETRTAYLSAKSIAVLARLGFSTDGSKGNFTSEVTISDPPDYDAIADRLLTALHDAYGAGGDVALEFDAPFAPRASLSCAPLS